MMTRTRLTRGALAALVASLRVSRYPLGLVSSALLAFAVVTALGIPQAQASFTLGDAANFAVLYEGNGGNTLAFNNSGITGNIGIGGTGSFASAGGCVGNCLITGVVEFSAAQSGPFPGAQFSSNNTTYVPALSPGVNPLYNQANVSADLAALNSLSQTLGGEAGTALTITSGGSANANSGNLVNGDRVFTLQAASNFPNGTFTITGTSSQTVVINVPFSFNFHGSIVLAGGITSDQVLFNFTGGTYATLSGGGSLDINTNGVTTAGTFLDPNGVIQISHSVLAGRIFGGDSQNMQIVSGAFITAPSRVPEPGSLVLLGAGLVALGVIRRLHRPAGRSKLLSPS